MAFLSQPYNVNYDSRQPIVYGSTGAVYSQQPINTYQPYQTYPIAAPQSTVFVYDETATRRRDHADAVESGMLAALCASCICCWILPPFPLWHIH